MRGATGLLSRKQLALVGGLREPGAAPVTDRERTISVPAKDTPQLDLDPAESACGECAAFSVADGVCVPDLDK